MQIYTYFAKQANFSEIITTFAAEIECYTHVCII